jgi:acyl-CoA dehydrogenase
MKADTDAVAAANAALPTLSRHAAEVDRTACFPLDSVRELRDNGLFGLLVPRQYGGMGGDLGDLVDVAQVLAAGCLSTAMIWAMHCQQVDALVRFAPPRLREDVLPRVAAGKLYLASITTEPGKGGHLLSAEAALRANEDRLTVERDGPTVTGGEHAEAFLVTMRDSAEALGTQVTLVYVERDQVAVETTGSWDPLGMRGTHSVAVRLRGEVAARQIVGERGRFRTVATESMIVAGHLGWTACWLGAARSALAGVIALARSPERPRGLDTRSALVAERVARVRVDLELASAYLNRVRDEVLEVRRAGRTMDDPVTQIHLNVLKVAVAELTFGCVDRLVQLTGLSTGYLRNPGLPLERHFRDLRSASMNNSNDRLLSVTGALSILDSSVRLA